jgi:hypothetical protein
MWGVRVFIVRKETRQGFSLRTPLGKPGFFAHSTAGSPCPMEETGTGPIPGKIPRRNGRRRERVLVAFGIH